MVISLTTAAVIQPDQLVQEQDGWTMLVTFDPKHEEARYLDDGGNLLPWEAVAPFWWTAKSRPPREEQPAGPPKPSFVRLDSITRIVADGKVWEPTSVTA